ncbi:MAG: hypothetical protein DLM70_19185 [Chloroflexi bacterium]|nr:MAG: hypothetical protein DLM70_19185 [Chloroflexota bacterium]
MPHRSVLPLLVTVVLALMLATPRLALAHALLLRADPPPDVLLRTAPARIHLWFSEDLNGSASRVVVWDRHRTVMNARGPALVPGHPRELEVALERLPPGSYLVVWTSVSADDGHLLRGSYLFSVKVRGPGPSLPGTASSGGGQGLPDAAGLGALFAHWLELLAAVAWIGSAAFSAFIFRSFADRCDPVMAGIEELRLRLLLRVSLVVLLSSSVADLVLQAYSLAGGDWGSAISTTTIRSIFGEQYGQLWLGRQALGLVALAATFATSIREDEPRGRELAVAAGERGSVSLIAPVPIIFGIIYLYLLAASGHAASVNVGTIEGSHMYSAAIFLDWLHLLGVALWFGGQIYIALALIPALLTSGASGGDTPLFLEILNRFSPVAYLSVALFSVPGTFNGAVHIPSWDAFLESVYGRSLIVKIGLVGIMILVSIYTVYILRPHLRRALAGPDPHLVVGSRGVKRLVWWLRVNPVLGAGVLLATSVLFFYPVPATLSARGQQWSQVALPGVTIHSLAVGHDHSGLVYAGTEQGVYRRARGGWQRVLAAQTIWSIDLAADDRSLVAGDEAGDVYVSSDGGQRWRHSLVTNQGVYAVSSRRGSPRWVLAGAGGGLYLSRDGGARWERRLRLRQSGGAAFAWLPGSSRVVFAGVVAGGPGGSTTVFMSRDAGESWHVFGRRLQSGGGVMSLAFTAHGQVFAGTMGLAVWRASLAHASWIRTRDGMPPGSIHGASLTVVPGRPGTLFVGTLGQGVFRTTDAGRHWSNISEGLPAGNTAIVLSVRYSPLQDALYAGTTDGVYRLQPGERD